MLRFLFGVPLILSTIVVVALIPVSTEKQLTWEARRADGALHVVSGTLVVYANSWSRCAFIDDPWYGTFKIQSPYFPVSSKWSPKFSNKIRGRGGEPGWVLYIPLYLIATPLAILSAGFLVAPIRRFRHVRRGKCIGCGYDLTANESGVCPECGTSIEWSSSLRGSHVARRIRSKRMPH